MTEGREARLWRILGIAFLLGGAAPLALCMLNLLPVLPGAPETRALDVWCSGAILLGIAALVAGRITAALRNSPVQRRDWPWTLVASAGMPLGALFFAVARQRTPAGSVTPSQEAAMLAAVLVFLAGLTALVSEPIVRRAQQRVQRRVARSLQNAELAARLVRVH